MPFWSTVLITVSMLLVRCHSIRNWMFLVEKSTTCKWYPIYKNIKGQTKFSKRKSTRREILRLLVSVAYTIKKLQLFQTIISPKIKVWGHPATWPTIKWDCSLSCRIDSFFIFWYWDHFFNSIENTKTSARASRRFFRYVRFVSYCGDTIIIVNLHIVIMC